MIKILSIMILLTACGQREVIDVVEYRPVDKEVRSSLVFETIAKVAVTKAGDYGFETAHMEHAQHLIDDKAIQEVRDKKQAYVLAFAYCADYRIACRAVYATEVEASEEAALAVGLHETLHLLGFGHEECPADGCKGVMGAYYQDFDDPEGTLTEEYVKSLPYNRPVQPGDVGV